MEDMGSAGETGKVMENGGLRDLNVIWIVLGTNQGQYTMCIVENKEDRTHRRTGLPFSTLEEGELRAGYQHVGREMVMMFIRGCGDYY